MKDDIYLILKNPNPEKTHEWGDISIRNIPLCQKTIWTLFLSFLEDVLYPDNWKNSNVVPTHII